MSFDTSDFGELSRAETAPKPGKVLVKDFARRGLKLYHDPARGKWMFYLRDSEGRQLRRDLPATTKAQALEMAEKLNADHLTGKGYLPDVDCGGHSVGEAIVEAINGKTGTANDATRKNYADRAEPFLQWLADRKLKARRWGDISTKIVRDYLNDILAEKNERGESLCFDTIRMRLFVVKMTSRYMAESYPDRYVDVARPVSLKGVRRAARTREVERALDAPTLQTFLGFLRQRRPDLWGIACLESLAGLRMLEAAHVREQDVDFRAATVRVTDTPAHKVKTPQSNRTIPVCGRVLEALRTAIQAIRVRHPDGYVFLTRRGEPWGPDGIMHAMKKALRQCWQTSGVEVLRDFQPHHLRATFATLVRRQRADSRVLQSYLGQVPTDVLGKHYEAISVDQMRSEIVGAIGAAMNAESVNEPLGYETNRANGVQ